MIKSIGTQGVRMVGNGSPLRRRGTVRLSSGRTEPNSTGSPVLHSCIFFW